MFAVARASRGRLLPNDSSFDNPRHAQHLENYAPDSKPDVESVSLDFMMAQGTSASSPISSPRLPSPPPFTEVQIGPKSPTIESPTGGNLDAAATSQLENGATRRIRPGSKAEEMASGPPLVPLADLDSAFQLQEHLQALYHNYTSPAASTSANPLTRTTARTLAQTPSGIDRALWLYELCRFLTKQVNVIIVAFFADTPPCSAQTCPEMRASEWQYLCAVHDPPKSCCAIDYCCHTLDWAANILTSTKHFPSRLTLGGEGGGGTQQGVRQITNIMRRLYRIFAHAWFQHRGIFWQVEGQTGLYVFFKTVCDMYQLIPEDNYTVPPEAEGLGDEGTGSEDQEHTASTEHPTREILRPSSRTTTSIHLEQGLVPNVTGMNTRRHKATPSTGSFVDTIVEGSEEGDHEEKKQRDQSISEESVVEEASKEGEQAVEKTEESRAESQMDGSKEKEEETRGVAPAEDIKIEETEVPEQEEQETEPENVEVTQPEAEASVEEAAQVTEVSPATEVQDPGAD